MRKLLNLIWRVVTFPFRLIVWPFLALYRRLHAWMTFEPESSSAPDVLATVITQPEALLEHIDALRKHLLRAVIALALTITLSFVFTRQIVDWLAAPIGGLQELQAIEVTESIAVFMRVALLAGFVLALPYITFEVWLFMVPGLKPKERIFSLLAIPAVAVFFVGGLLFTYYAMLPTALPFLLNFMGITTLPRPQSYINFVTGLMFWVGLAFEFPFVIYVLTAIGIIQPRWLVDHWRLAVILIAILAAVITPTPDPVNMSLVMLPMLALYLLSIGLAALAHRRRPKS
jgi:sec-independent protein translocase protein TatC